MLPVSTKHTIRFTPPRFDRAPILAEKTKVEAELAAIEEDEGTVAQRALIGERLALFDSTLALIEARIAEAGGAVPVYELKVPTVADRARFTRELASAGATWPADITVAAALRHAIREISPDNAQELLDLADEVESGKGDEGAMLRYAALEGACRQHPVYGSLIGQRVFWQQMQVVLLGRMFLAGWEGVAAEFRTVGGIVPEEVLGHLAPADLEAIAGRVNELFYLSGAAAKN